MIREKLSAWQSTSIPTLVKTWKFNLGHIVSFARRKIPEKSTSYFTSGYPSINPKADCDGCQECVTQCPTQCITIKGKDDSVTVDMGACITCGQCEEACSPAYFVCDVTQLPPVSSRSDLLFNKSKLIQLQSSSES